jgi:hypothetical protein
LVLKLNRKRIAQVGRWLALALLLAQFGAEIHLYSHPIAEASDQLGTARSCGTCFASSQLQQAVAPPAGELQGRALVYVAILALAATPAVRRSHFRAFRSRAPPAFG